MKPSWGREERREKDFGEAEWKGWYICDGEGVRAQMNLLDSHDTERFLTTVKGDLRRVKLATLFGMTYVGAASIY